MSEQKYEEKELQKQEEKREEKAPEEKQWDEKYRRDPVGTIVFAAIVIWAGIVLFADNLGWLGWLLGSRSEVVQGWWLSTGVGGIIAIGAGIIVLLGVLYRLSVPAHRRPILGSIIFAIILIAIGLGDLVNWNIVWPIILVAIGLGIIIRATTRRRA